MSKAKTLTFFEWHNSVSSKFVFPPMKYDVIFHVFILLFLFNPCPIVFLLFVILLVHVKGILHKEIRNTTNGMESNCHQMKFKTQKMETPIRKQRLRLICVANICGNKNDVTIRSVIFKDRMEELAWHFAVGHFFSLFMIHHCFFFFFKSMCWKCRTSNDRFYILSKRMRIKLNVK